MPVLRSDAMVTGRLRLVLLALIAFAIVGGPSSQLARSAENLVQIAAVGIPCDVMMPQTGANHDQQMPCKGFTPECIKQMGCIVDIALPTCFFAITPAIHSVEVAYWPAWSSSAGFLASPEPLPPRTT